MEKGIIFISVCKRWDFDTENLGIIALNVQIPRAKKYVK